MKLSRHPRAFTMIEMLAATALTALAMVIVLRVIAGIGRSRSAMMMQENRNPWPASLTQLVRWDIAHAQKMFATTDGFSLEGFGGLDPQTRAPDGQPVNIQYTIATVGQTRWLIRRQTPLSTSAGGDTWSEMVCADVQSVQLAPVEESERTKIKTDSSNQVPDTVRLLVRSSKTSAQPLDQLICVH